jgi:TatD DNase family protein
MPETTTAPTPAALIDSHCHLDFDAYGEDRAAMLERARQAGLVNMICIGSGRDIASARSAVALAAQEPDIFATVGIHPHDVAKMTEADWDELGQLASAPRVVGVGETGLDYYYDHSPREAQQSSFRRFLQLCHKTAQPVVCHIRDAHDDAVAILTEVGVPARGGVIHCFTGTPADAEKYLALGLHLSFSGIITFKTAGDIRAAAALAPLERILIETDAPYLAPIPFRGKRNEPAYIVKTAAAVAAAKEVDVATLAAATTDNARRLFRLL